MADEVRVQHIFRDPETGFTDALVLPKAEYDRLKPRDIADRKAARVAAHRAMLEEVKSRPLPSEAEIVAAREAERVELEARLAALAEPVVEDA